MAGAFVALCFPNLAAAQFSAYQVPTAASQPFDIANGPDGNLWFTEWATAQIGRLTPGGTFAEFSIPSAESDNILSIKSGPDGNLWATFNNTSGDAIAQISTSGAVTNTFQLPSGSGGPVNITFGSDGALWYVRAGDTEGNAGKIGRMTLQGSITEYNYLTPQGTTRNTIAAGPDNNLWFTEFDANKIGRITTAGTVTEYPIPSSNSGPIGITAGPDGALWFTETATHKIGRITIDGTVTNEYTIPTYYSPEQITTGSDNALWFTVYGDGQGYGGRIGRITTGGVITLFLVPVSANASSTGPQGITTGQDGALWFAEQTGNAIGRLPTSASPVSNNSHDFNGDGTSDILWRATSGGNLAVWLMNAGQNAGQIRSGVSVGQVSSVWSVVGTRDFNGDSFADVLWLDHSGDLAIWFASANGFEGATLGNVGAQWSVVGTGDFNGDGTGDILWRDSAGDLAIWLMSNGQLSSGVSLGQVSNAWSVAGTGDFNGDGTTDILWKDTSGNVAIWLMSNGQLSSGITLGNVGTSWTVAGTGDFDGDGTSDILWKDTSGDYAIWLMHNGQFSSGATIASGVANTWSVAETGDFNGDGKSDILWTDQSGDVGLWLMSGTSVSSYISLGNVGTSWQVQGQNAD